MFASEDVLLSSFLNIEKRREAFGELFTAAGFKNQPIRAPGLKPEVWSGLILSGASYPDLKIGVWRRRTYQKKRSPSLPAKSPVPFIRIRGAM
jgi:hypothetical protein